MKVILTADVENLGRKGSVVSVADGYARNYLIPRGMAIKATRGALKQAEDMKRAREAAEARAVARAQELASALEGSVISVEARVGKDGKLFGSVTTADIAAAIESQREVSIDRKQVELEEPIRQIGEYDVSLRLHPQVVCTVKVAVGQS